jgi:hypothetical protein
MKTICRRSSVPLLALFFLLVTSGTAVAQTGAIAGTVRDAASQAPLSAVFVEVVSSAGATVASGYSGPSGTFRVVEIPPGTYAVTFNSPGWRTLTVDDQMVEAGRSNRLAVEMEEQRYSLNPITVTASKTEEKLLDAPAMVEVAPISQIEALPATTPMEHIKNKAGVDVMTTGVQSNYVDAHADRQPHRPRAVSTDQHRAPQPDHQPGPRANGGGARTGFRAVRAERSERRDPFDHQVADRFSRSELLTRRRSSSAKWSHRYHRRAGRRSAVHH